MRITILTVGSRGDVLPFIALGGGLSAAGQEVTLATHGEWEGEVRAAGLGYRRLEGAPIRFLDTREGQRWIATGAKPVVFLRDVLPCMLRLLREQLHSAETACTGAEALVFTPLAVAGWHMAEKLGLPCCGATLQPVSPTRDFPSPVLPPSFSFGPYNRATHVMVDHGYAEVWRRETNRWRCESLGLPHLPPGYTYSRFRGAPLPLLCGFSPVVVPRPCDWRENVRLTGYWFSETPPGWAPSRELAGFLTEGPAPVYVGLGSMEVSTAAATAALAVRAVRRTGRRLILAGALARCAGPPLPPDVFALETVPHGWLFPRVAAVVHHGGAGTTGAALRAGVPSVAVPFVADQYFWGARVEMLGAGPAAVPYTRLTAGRLAAAISRCVEDDAMRNRARGIGERVRQEDGVGRAVASLAGILGFAADPMHREVPVYNDPLDEGGRSE